MVVLLSKAVGKFSRKLTQTDQSRQRKTEDPTRHSPARQPTSDLSARDRLRWALVMGRGQPHTHSCFLAHQLLKLGKAQRL
jgi:hypothetical protein